MELGSSMSIKKRKDRWEAPATEQQPCLVCPLPSGKKHQQVTLYLGPSEYQCAGWMRNGPWSETMKRSSGDGGSEWMRKRGAHLAGQGKRSEGGKRTRRHARLRPLLRPILVQAAGPRFDDRPREQDRGI